MYSMRVTAEVFQLEMSWLKAKASMNMPSMRVTAEVSQLEMSALNLSYPLNRSLISVTWLTSQSLIGVPSCRQLAPVGSAATQLSTAAFRAARSGKAHLTTPSPGQSTPTDAMPPRRQQWPGGDLGANSLSEQGHSGLGRLPTVGGV